jgi:hypothetical protein
MKVLFDENVPHKLRRHFNQHNVRTAADMGWVGIKNGELLRLAEAEGFEVMVTGDQNLTYQQNLQGRRIGLVVLETNNWHILKLQPELINQAIAAATPVSFSTVKFILRPPRKPN